MVLQQKTNVAVWGTTDKNKKVTIAPSWTKKKYSTEPSDGGKWFIRIPTPEAGGPYSITFSDGEKTTIGNVLIGEVWYCSGQSNMEMPMKGFRGQPVEYAADYIANAKPSRPIRMCTIGKKLSKSPLDTSNGSWTENTPEAVAATSAVAYFFAIKVQEALDTPVGLLISDWGGTPIEGWMNRETLEKEFKGEFDLSFLDDSTPLPEKGAAKKPCLLFNGQVHPLIPFTFKGMLWYQGETNRHRDEQYSRLQPAYVKMMRNLFQNPDAPFYFVQIAPYKYSNPDKCSSGYFY
jgi:sialate O-acetylesterase